MKLSRLPAAVLFTLIFLLAGACSVELTQTNPAPTAAVPAGEPSEATAPVATPTATQESVVEPTQASPPTGGLEETASGAIFAGEPVTGLDIVLTDSFAAQDLTGHLVFLTLTAESQVVLVMDLSSGEISSIFQAPNNSWVLSASVSPDLEQLLLSYAPPPPEGQAQFGYSDLYMLAMQSGDLSPVLERSQEFEAYFSSVWAPGGESIYYTHFVSDDSVGSGFRYNVARVAYPSGSPETVVQDAFWQRLSPDGSRLAYVTFNPDGSEFDELFVANADGSDPQRVLDPQEFPTIDAPFFHPNNQFLYFSAISEKPPSLSWLERLAGVRIARAHDVPSDWWQVDLNSGATSKLTDIRDQGMYASFSPDSQKIGFISTQGAFVMNPDGSGLVQIVESASLFGSVEWLP